MLYTTEKHLNAGEINYLKIFKCDDCGELISEMWPRYEDNENHYCLDCGLKLGLISEVYYLKSHGFSEDMFRAGINSKTKEIEVVYKKEKFEWELKTQEDYRKSVFYKQWRELVFKRDFYTCQNCGQKGGELNAHHIKSFKNYPEERFNTENGITLCVSCHYKVHRKGD